MVITYRNNRLAPALIIATCLWLFYFFVDPSIDIGVVLPSWSYRNGASQTPPPSTEQHARPNVEPPASISSIDEPKKSERTLAANEILLMMKTGGTSMWKRLLIHLPTTLADVRIPRENTAIYSDFADVIGNFSIIDVLANTTAATKAKTDFDVYRSQAEYVDNNVYVEFAGVPGDDWGPVGGWTIDKYKFMPLVQHAGNNWPAVKWYIYMEDDTYLFLPNVLRYLNNFDWREPHYLGSYAAKSDVVFAHGGAGFALSRGAWEASFGQNTRLSEDFEDYTAKHCCGDQVLGRALNQYGVRFGENRGDEKFKFGFNPKVHWNFAFDRWNWCEPLMSWHKVHSRDVARYYALERSWDFTKPLRHRDFFNYMIAPSLRKRVDWWDNLSASFEITSANQMSPPVPSNGDYKSGLWRNAWQSTEACEAACQSWSECVQWSYVEDLCKMDDKVSMGQGFAPEMSQRKSALMTTSGWFKDRIRNWSCE